MPYDLYYFLRLGHYCGINVNDFISVFRWDFNFEMRILADISFQKSMLALPAREQKDAIKTLDLLTENPNHPSLRIHPVKESKSNFYTIRMSGGGRMVALISKDVVHLRRAFSKAKHDDAYLFARTSIPKVGEDNIEVVSIPDSSLSYDEDLPTYEPVPDYQLPVAQDRSDTASGFKEPKEKPLFARYSDAQIEACGVSANELELVHKINAEQELVELEDKFSPLAHNNLVALYLGDEIPNKLVNGRLVPTADELKLFEYDGSEEIKAALTEPWASWLVFLSNSQRQIANTNFKGPSKVFGGAGTGKTVVALHRAKFLIQNRELFTENGVGLVTFSRVLANDLNDKMDLLIGADTDARKKVCVAHLEEVAHKIIKINAGPKFHLTTDYTTRTELAKLHKKYGLENDFTSEFVISEFMNVVGPWGLWDFEKYKNFQRLGRQTPLREKQRKTLSELFLEFRRICKEKRLITEFEFYQKAAEVQSTREPIFDHLIIDETQDLGPHMLAFVRGLVAKKPDDIMLCGDTGQSLYTRHHSFRKHGFDVQGRSKKLYVNYRTSRQIKETADKVNEFLLELSDEPNENRRSISIFNGPQPTVELFKDRETEMHNLVNWIQKCINDGHQPHEVIVLSSHNLALTAASKAIDHARIRCWTLDASANYLSGEVGLATVRRVKGLEYRSVAIIGCDEDQFPNANKMNELGDGSDFDEFLTLEKNSLYVAMTRARDNLLVSGVTPGSAFLEELA